MKKVFKKIFPEFDDLPEGHRLKKLYKECEKREDNLVTNLLETSKELMHFQKTKIPRCPICKVPMEPAIDTKTGKISKYLWKTACGHNKDLILGIG